MTDSVRAATVLIEAGNHDVYIYYGGLLVLELNLQLIQEEQVGCGSRL